MPAKRNPAKIQITTWQTLSKYYIGFLENNVVELMEDLHEFHSQHVDPSEVSVSMAFYQLLHSEENLNSARTCATFSCCPSTARKS